METSSFLIKSEQNCRYIDVKPIVPSENIYEIDITCNFEIDQSDRTHHSDRLSVKEYDDNHFMKTFNKHETPHPCLAYIHRL